MNSLFNVGTKIMYQHIEFHHMIRVKKCLLHLRLCVHLIDFFKHIHTKSKTKIHLILSYSVISFF